MKYLSFNEIETNNMPIIYGISKTDLNKEFSDNLIKFIEEKELWKFNTISPFYDYNDDSNNIIIVGLGEDELTMAKYQELFSNITKSIKLEACIDIDSFVNESNNEEYLARLASETYYLKSYKTINYKQKDETSESNLFITSKKDISSEVNVGRIYAEATNHARDLVNMPSNKLDPIELANYSQKLAKELNIDYVIYDKKQIEELKMGGLLGVNYASTTEPRFIVLKYKGNNESDEFDALVGKGITFDTGGYTLKPGTSMVNMKSDMGGAATVLGAFEAIAKLKLKVNVWAIVPTTDNMVNGHGLKPDDVITSMSGKTIEIVSTDAEGRLILCDGITYAREKGARKIFDVATLTGGVVVALGNKVTGVMTNNDELLNEFIKTQEETDELMWQLPIYPHEKKRVKNSDVADLKNSDGRLAHAVYAGAFLSEFAEDTPWVHIDIAGTAGQKAPSTLGPKGGTGVMVRTITKYFENNQ